MANTNPAAANAIPPAPTIAEQQTEAYRRRNAAQMVKKVDSTYVSNWKRYKTWVLANNLKIFCLLQQSSLPERQLTSTSQRLYFN